MEECIICFDETTQFVFFPCAHKVCSECHKRIHRCPLCNYTVDLEIQLVPIPIQKATCSRICGIFLFSFVVCVAYQYLTHSGL